MYFKLCTLYKIVHNLVYFPPNVISPKYSSVTVTPEPFLYQPSARTTTYYSSFVPSSVSVWNNLPSEALTANSIHPINFSYIPLSLGCTLELALCLIFV